MATSFENLDFYDVLGFCRSVEVEFWYIDMGESDDGCSTQLIDGNGEFNVKGLDNFVKKTKLSDCGLSYAVVAIMGPQSSGMRLWLCFCSSLIDVLSLQNFFE